MKKLLFLLMSLLFVLAFNVEHANAVPDIRGDYSGTYTTVVSNCTDSEKNGTYNDVPLSMIFSNQTGDSFSGSATGTFNIDGFNETEYIQISGTITETWQISGITSHTFWGTGGVGTFTGQLSGNTLSIENPGHDTYGETCTYIRYMSATLEPCQIFVVASSAPGDEEENGVIVQVSPVTGNQTIISSGGLFQDGPKDIEVDKQGDLIVTTNSMVGALAPEGVVRIDRVTGTQTIISQGGYIDFFVGGLAIEKNGDLIVGNHRYRYQKLIRINPQSGIQSIITKWSLTSGPKDIVIESNGQILVAGTGIEKIGDINYVVGAIYRVDPITGAYSIVSLGGELGRPNGIALDAMGNIFVTGAGIVKVNPSNGSQSVIYKSTQYSFRGIDVDSKGDLIVTALRRGLSGVLLRIDPVTGADEVISEGFDYPLGVTTTCVTTNRVTPTPPQPSCPKAMPWIPLLLTDE